MPKTAAVKSSPVVKTQAKSATPKKPELKVVQSKQAPVSKGAPNKAKKPAKAPVAKRDFKVGDYVVYPTHGVGRITGQETQEIGGMSLKLLVISFEKDKMTLRVPVHRAQAAGLRHVSCDTDMARVFNTLQSKPKVSRGMWSRRAQEYESKINSGNVISVAEVVRDLHQNVDQAERSYSERMIYESALGRLVGELAAAESVNTQAATDKLLKVLRARKAA